MLPLSKYEEYEYVLILAIKDCNIYDGCLLSDD